MTIYPLPLSSKWDYVLNLSVCAHSDLVPQKGLTTSYIQSLFNPFHLLPMNSKDKTE